MQWDSKGAVSKQNEFLRQSPFFNLKSKQAKVHKKIVNLFEVINFLAVICIIDFRQVDE